MDPISAAGLFASIMAAMKNIRDLTTETVDPNMKAKLNDVYDVLLNLKHSAVELEEENRELKEKLRFKAGDYVFRNPFHYAKDDTSGNQPYCTKCFAKQVLGQMGPPYQSTSSTYRRCLVCDAIVDVASGQRFRDSMFDQSGGDWRG
jgi:hypothetical protein